MNKTLVRFLFILSIQIGFLSLSSVQAQTHFIWVSGQVLKEKDKTPLAGISVYQKKTGQGLATDEQGRFRIRMEASDTLVFRGIGYQDKTYIPALRSATELRVNVLLKEGSVELQTVEVGPGLNYEQVDRAVRNMKPRAAATPRMGPGVPKIIITPTPPSSKAPSVLSALSSPASFMWETFSKDAQSRRRVVKLTEERAAELKRDSVRQARLRYNRFFQDTTSFRE